MPQKMGVREELRVQEIIFGEQNEVYTKRSFKILPIVEPGSPR